MSIKGRLAKMPQRKTTQQITKLLTLACPNCVYHYGTRMPYVVTKSGQQRLYASRIRTAHLSYSVSKALPRHLGRPSHKTTTHLYRLPHIYTKSGQQRSYASRIRKGNTSFIVFSRRHPRLLGRPSSAWATVTHYCLGVPRSLRRL